MPDILLYLPVYLLLDTGAEICQRSAHCSNGRLCRGQAGGGSQFLAALVHRDLQKEAPSCPNQQHSLHHPVLNHLLTCKSLSNCIGLGFREAGGSEP